MGTTTSAPATFGSDQRTHESVRFVVSADARFFPAALGMLESLHRSGNTAPAFVVDCGLQPEQRERLLPLARIRDVPASPLAGNPVLARLTADRFWSTGVVVLLDADMIVTSSLDDLVDRAKRGLIAVHPDHDITTGRQFPEWVGTFRLRGALRPQRYVNCAPLAVSLDYWPGFFARWRDACAELPDDWPTQSFAGPFGLGDQDALNALLMSEIPSASVWIGPDGRTVHADALREVDILEPESLTCRYRGASPVVLHYGLDPKPWERAGWRRIRPDDAYVRLLRQLLFDPEASVRARSREVPLWLRPRGIGGAAARFLGLVNFLRVDVRRKARIVRNRLFRRETGRDWALDAKASPGEHVD